VKTDHL